LIAHWLLRMRYPPYRKLRWLHGRCCTGCLAASARGTLKPQQALCSAAFFLGPVKDDDLPKDAEPGCTLSGPINLAKTGPNKSNGVAPTKAELVYTVPAAKKRKENGDSKDNGTKEEEEDGKGPIQKMREARRDADVRFDFHFLCFPAQ
jgi:hypothetical protein